uniref:G patch domain-containing protein 4 n=1 Tax=Caligus clemensi TaxID=344056 RepID=C1C0K2_CALCM|nr:G patch domain-containing protein 4 [Caligus clemensi]
MSDSFNRKGSFARRLMESQGWDENSGLGKKSQGISKPIKPALKFDSSGLGFDLAKEFTDHWWARAYNQAAQNIDVNEDEDGSVTVKSKKSKKKSKVLSKVEKKSRLYSGFVKSATLDNGVLKEESQGQEEKKEPPQIKVLSDEELFAACEGLTAHKIIYFILGEHGMATAWMPSIRDWLS